MNLIPIYHHKFTFPSVTRLAAARITVLRDSRQTRPLAHLNSNARVPPGLRYEFPFAVGIYRRLMLSGARFRIDVRYPVSRQSNESARLRSSTRGSRRTLKMSSSTIDTTIDAASFRPRDAVAKLEAHMREGARYPQLRALVADWLASAVQPAQFVTECIKLIHEEISKDPRNISSEDHNDADMWVAVFLLLDCLRDVPGAWEECNRKSFSTTIKSCVVLCAQSRAKMGSLVRSIIVSPNTTVPARVTIRLIQTYGLELEDLRLEEASDKAHPLTKLTRKLIAESKYNLAISLVIHFSLTDFVKMETLQLLAQGNEFALSLELLEVVSDRQLTRAWIEYCISEGTRNHAALRQAYKACTAFQLETEFPEVRSQYFKSTISRMIGKGQFEAALSHAGSDVDLQRWVIESLASIEEFEYAFQYADRCGLDFSCDPIELEKVIARRRETFFQLPAHLDDSIVFVNDEASLLNAMDHFLANESIVGLDTEWGAAVGEGANQEKKTRVATLQLATQNGVVILDIPRLVENFPEALEKTVGRILQDKDVLKLGFAVQEDLHRLAMCHSSFNTVHNVADLQSLWKCGVLAARSSRASTNYPWSSREELARYQPISLSTLVATVLGKPLDKTMRMSNWSQRPLSTSQILYAALDAWTLVEVHLSLQKHSGAKDEYEYLLAKVRRSYNSTS